MPIKSGLIGVENGENGPGLGIRTQSWKNEGMNILRMLVKEGLELSTNALGGKG